MSSGQNTIAGGKFVIAWDYNNTTDTLTITSVPTNPARNIFQGQVVKTADGDVGGYTEITQDDPRAQALVDNLVTAGNLPGTYPANAAAAGPAARRAKRLARIADLQAEVARLNAVRVD